MQLSLLFLGKQRNGPNKKLYLSLFWGLTLLVSAGGSGCKVSKLEPVTFATSYQSEGRASAITAAPACAIFRQVNVVDERRDKRLAGVRLMQHKDGRSDIFVEGDVESWLRAGVSRGLVQAHFPQDESAPLDLRVKLAAIHIEEVAFRNSTFEGRVVLDVELADAESGEAVWTHRTDGVAGNYGRPGKAKNYQETVNHALDRAVARVVNDHELRDKLCGSTNAASR